MKYVVARVSKSFGKEVYLEDKNSKTIPKMTLDLKNAEILTENEAYEWLGRFWSIFPEDRSITKIKINPKTLELNYTELY